MFYSYSTSLFRGATFQALKRVWLVATRSHNAVLATPIFLDKACREDS